MSDFTKLPEVYCCCGRPYSAHPPVAPLSLADCHYFTPRPLEAGDIGGVRLCSHGFQHWSCGDCCPRRDA